VHIRSITFDALKIFFSLDIGDMVSGTDFAPSAWKVGARDLGCMRREGNSHPALDPLSQLMPGGAGRFTFPRGLCLLCPGYPSCILCLSLFLARTELFQCVFGLCCFAKCRSSDSGSLLHPSTGWLNPRVIPVPCHDHDQELNRNSAYSDVIQIYLAASLCFSSQFL